MFINTRTKPPKHLWGTIVVFLTLWITACTVSFGQNQGTTNIRDSSAIHTLEKFRDAITSGDRVLAGKNLSKNAIIMQAGKRVTREEYIYKHIIPECKYVYSVNQKIDSRIIRQVDSVTWISSTYSVKVTHKGGSTIKRNLAELAIMHRIHGVWKIDMIHWSNCPRYPK